MRTHQPDIVIFLGDMLDSGVLATERFEWALWLTSTPLTRPRHARYVRRFRNIFPLPSAPARVYYVPGNHDLGLYLPPAAAAHAREQFKDAFGPLNAVVEIGGHRLVWIDSMALLEERLAAAQARTTYIPPGGASSFIGQFQQCADSSSVEKPDDAVAAQLNVHAPRILFSHIPLWRPPGTSCGPRRESGRPLSQGRGVNYQNLLDEETSQFLLDGIDPAIVFRRAASAVVGRL